MNYKTLIILVLIGILFLSIFLHGYGSSKEGVETKPVIPLKIYQTWRTKELPEKMRENVERLKSQNPDFEYHLFDDEDCRKFMHENFEGDVLKAYDKIIPGAYKADLWRYCILYINGGIYLDIKYSNVGDFNLIQLTDKEYFVPDLKESGGGVYNAFMICKPGNKILREAISRVVENVKNEYYGESGLYPTGPMLLKDYFSRNDVDNMNKNGLKICRYKENTSICLHGKPILIVYDEYYKTDVNKNGQLSYWKLWEERKIYK
jgi:mannosyltransferase OCH1-like enzyme